MKTFQVNYICRNLDQKEYCSKIIRALSEKSALKKFAKMSNIINYTYLFDEDFCWEDGDSEWLAWYHSIEEVNYITCPHCKGTGQLRVEK